MRVTFRYRPCRFCFDLPRRANNTAPLKQPLRTSFLLALLYDLVVAAKAALDLDFTLVNNAGYDIQEVCVGPTTSDDWGDNVLKDILKDGQSLELKFHPKATAEKWDIKVVYTDGETAWWKGYKLTEINKINLFWSKDKGSTATSE